MAPEECEQTKLKLTNTSLDQAFMDRLANISSRLTVLKAKVRHQLHLTVHLRRVWFATGLGSESVPATEELSLGSVRIGRQKGIESILLIERNCSSEDSFKLEIINGERFAILAIKKFERIRFELDWAGRPLWAEERTVARRMTGDWRQRFALVSTCIGQTCRSSFFNLLPSVYPIPLIVADSSNC